MEANRKRSVTRRVIAILEPARDGAVLMGLLSGFVIGCGGASEGSDDGATQAQESQALYGGGSFDSLWPGANTTAGASVPVCWEQGSDTGSLEGDGTSVPVNGPPLKAQVRNAVENSWGHAANLRFTGWGTCPSTTNTGNPGRIAIHWETKTIPRTSDGFFASQWTRSRLNPTSTTLSTDAIHEFGHALGFAHEQERPDNWDSAGNAIFCGRTDGSTKALTGGVKFTTSFDQLSIMSYCALIDFGVTTLSVGDIAGVQNAYGRKTPGSIVGPNNRCLDIPLSNGTFSPGTQLQVFNCNSGGNQKWQRTTSLQMFAPAFSSKSFLDVRNAVTGDNGVVQAFTKNTPVSANQQWSFNSVQIQGMGFQCVNVPSPGLANNTILQLGACAGNNLNWNVNPSGATGTIQQGSFCWDVPNGSTADHTPIQVFQCNGGTNQKFTLQPSGQIAFGTSGKCVDVRPDNNSLQLFPCKGSSDFSKANQLWNLHGAITGIGGNCLDIVNGNASDNVPVQTFHCTGSANQTWDYYFD